MPLDLARLPQLLPNPYVVLDTQLRIVWMNEAYLRVTMRAREDIEGREMIEAFPSDPSSESHMQLMSSLRRVLETGEADEIALIRYDIANPDGQMETRYWSATHTPILNAEGQVEHIIQHTVDVTELESLRRLRDEAGLVDRARSVQRRSRNLATVIRHYRELVEQAPGFIAVLTGPDHRFEIANSAYRKLVGRRGVIGKSVAEALPEVVEQGFTDLLDEVRATAKPYRGTNQQVFLGNESDDTTNERFLDFIYQPLIDPANGEVSGIFVQGHDVTEQVLALEHQTLMVNELNHRVKNTLAIVLGLAAQSFRSLPGAEANVANFNARLNALAAAHNILTERNWEETGSSSIIQGSIAASAGEDAARCFISGDEIELPAQNAVALAMIVHELTTNAIKYGALSVPDGSITIQSSRIMKGDAPVFRFVWREHGGPPVVPPERKGFGTRLIRLGFSADATSNVDIRYDPEGLICVIEGTVK